MIIAAAVKFQIEATCRTVVLCGVRHGAIFAQLADLGFKPGKGYKEVEQGFIDNNGKFMNRTEAYLHAKKCGQLAKTVIRLKEQSKSSDIELFSEDIW